MYNGITSLIIPFVLIALAIFVGVLYLVATIHRANNAKSSCRMILPQSLKIKYGVSNGGSSMDKDHVIRISDYDLGIRE